MCLSRLGSVSPVMTEIDDATLREAKVAHVKLRASVVLLRQRPLATDIGLLGGMKVRQPLGKELLLRRWRGQSREAQPHFTRVGQRGLGVGGIGDAGQLLPTDRLSFLGEQLEATRAEPAPPQKEKDDCDKQSRHVHK